MTKKNIAGLHDEHGFPMLNSLSAVTIAGRPIDRAPSNVRRPRLRSYLATIKLRLMLMVGFV